MNLEVYTLCCHACGKLHDLHAIYITIPWTIEAPDGNTYGARACGDCIDKGDLVNKAYNALVAGTFAAFKEANWR